MGATALAADSILVSPRSGMDLARGVSGKNAERNASKAQLKDPKSFDQQLSKVSDQHEKEPVRNNRPAKAAPQMQDEKKLSKPASDAPAKPKSEPEESDDSDTSVVSLPADAQAQSQSACDQGETNQSEQPAMGEPILASSSQTATLNALLQKQADSAEKVKAVDGADKKEQADALKEAFDLQVSKVEEAKDEKGSTGWTDISKGLVGENADGKGGLPVAAKDEGAKPSFKQVMDSLWVEKNLQMPTDQQAMSFVKTDHFQTNVDPLASAQVTRSHLVSDMQPLVSKVITSNTGGEMIMSLRPANMGTVRVEIQVDSGNVKVGIQAEQVAAKNALQSQIGELKDQLSSIGLKVDHVSVSTMPASSSESNRQFDSQQQPEHSGRDQETQKQAMRDQERQKQSDFAEAFSSFDEEKDNV